MPSTVLVTGAGPIGLLAALASASSAGSTCTSWTAPPPGPKPELVRALGGTYHAGALADVGFRPDVIVECTGVGQVIADCLQAASGSPGVVCLTGVGSGGRTTGFAADVAAAMVLQNNVVVGSVNANRRHLYKAAQVLARADRAWLGRLITRCEGPMRALQRQPGDMHIP